MSKRVYVSSTFADLREHRAAVTQMLQQMRRNGIIQRVVDREALATRVIAAAI